MGGPCGGMLKGPPAVWPGGLSCMGWRWCPTLPHPGECSTIGVSRLSFRVRYGSGRFPGAMTTATTIGLLSYSTSQTHVSIGDVFLGWCWCWGIVEWTRDSLEHTGVILR